MSVNSKRKEIEVTDRCLRKDVFKCRATHPLGEFLAP